MKVSGLADWCGQQLVFFETVHPFVIILVITLLITFLGEFSSNTAVVETFLPVLAGLALTLNVNPLFFMIPATLGKALGGAMGGFTSGKKEIIDMLRQRSRPYLFSNSLSPVIVGASIAVFDMLSSTTELRDKLEANIKHFKAGIKKAGLEIREGDSAIVPVMLYDAKLAQEFANRLLKEGIYAIGFFYPVVPKGLARIRVQLSAAHTTEQLDRAVAAFEKIGKELGVVK